MTDHHLPDTELPPALAVINPNRRDCAYPEKNLCGAGVTFKLVQAMLRALEWPDERVRKMSESLLKMIAVATIADVVPLVGENRIIVKRGLEGFQPFGMPAFGRYCGWLVSMKVSGPLRVKSLSASRLESMPPDVWRVLPMLSRCSSPRDDEHALRLATELHDLNKERQDTEAEIVKLIHEICDREPVTDSDFALVFSGAGWHRGVIGIVASRIVERYHRPVFVLSEDEETGLAQGSGRSIAAFHLLEALESMPELFTKFGGHRQAAGVTLPADRVAEFRQRLNAHATSVLTPDDLCATVEVDAKLSLTELTEPAIDEVFALAPFGCGNGSPVFAVCDAELAGPPALFKDKLLKLAIRQDGRTIMATSWNLAPRACRVPDGSTYNFAVCLEEENRGYGKWRVVVKEATLAS